MYTKMLHAVALALIAALGAACGETSGAPAGTAASAREVLAETVEMGFEGTGSALAISARRVVGGDVTHRVAMGVPSGTLALRADASGAIVLEHLDVELDDIVIDADDLPPAGLHLTDLRVSVAATEAAEASWSADGSAAVSAVTADLSLEWSLVSDGRVVRLAPQRIPGVALQLEVGTAADGGVSVTLRGGRGGAFLRPAGVFELSDLTVELTALR